jgi:HAD superfamily hydrolase (TIGR01509 family)
VIRAVVFDIGGILEPPWAEALLGELPPFVRMERGRFQAHLAEHHVALTEGRMSLAELYGRILPETGAPAPGQAVARHLDVYLRATARLDARVLELVDALERRYVVACLTNTEREVGELNRRRGLYRPFHRAYLSTEIGLHKPGRAIFEWVLRDLGCAGPEVVFVDDGDANVRGAREAGLHAIHYRDFDQLTGELAGRLADPAGADDREDPPAG